MPAKAFRISQAIAEFTLYSKFKSRRSGRVIPRSLSTSFCLGEGVVTRRSRISQPSVVGRMMTLHLCR
jgi:hypothetical protein